MNFDGPEALGRNLLYLDSHPDEYDRYVSWKRKFAADSNLNPSVGFLRAVND